VFGRFQRLSAKPTGGENSTGLGLSIVKRITELHGGRVSAESPGLGQGATFTIQLPYATGPSQ
jgi:signal transduction histidine kinase